MMLEVRAPMGCMRAILALVGDWVDRSVGLGHVGSCG